MGLNKKQKKQIDIARKKLGELRQRLAGSKKQADDPEETRRLQEEIKTLETQVEKILAEG